MRIEDLYSRFCAVPDEEMQPRLESALKGIEVCCLKTVSSTNDIAKQMLSSDGGIFLVASVEQTAGRGRRGRVFHSNAGGLYFSLGIKGALSPRANLFQTASAGVAVCGAIEDVCGIEPQIKWTNDVVFGGKKLCGILAEQVSAGDKIEGTVIGIGVNIRPEGIPPEIRDIASSLSEACGREPDYIKLLKGIVKGLMNNYALLREDRTEEILEDYRALQLVTGKRIDVVANGVSREAEAVLIDEKAALVVRYCDTGETVALISGEVSVRL